MLINYNTTTFIVLALWVFGLIFLHTPSFFKKQKHFANSFIIAGILLFIFYIVNLWINLERAPMRTLGETRLWYSFFLPSIGMFIFYKWKLKWMPVFSLSMAALFILINYSKPEYFYKTLMPALQSYWFVPHVIVYIFAYALLAASTLIAFIGLIRINNKEFSLDNLAIADNIVYLGFAFLTFGLLFGALWAKEAWGNYWTWDPKETWSFITWLFYLLYIHYRYFYRKNIKAPLLILTLAFVVLLICWFGVNYLPSAQNSVHVYSN